MPCRATDDLPVRWFHALLAVPVVGAAAYGLVASGALARGYGAEEEAAIAARWEVLVVPAATSEEPTLVEQGLASLLDRWGPIWKQDRDVLLMQGMWDAENEEEPVRWGARAELDPEHREVVDDFLVWLETVSGDRVRVPVGDGVAWRSLAVTAMATSRDDPRTVLAIGALATRVRRSSQLLAGSLSYAVTREALARGRDQGVDEQELQALRPELDEFRCLLAHEALQLDAALAEETGYGSFIRLVYRDAWCRSIELLTGPDADLEALAERDVPEDPGPVRMWLTEKLQDPNVASRIADGFLVLPVAAVARAHLWTVADFDAVPD